MHTDTLKKFRDSRTSARFDILTRLLLSRRDLECFETCPPAN